MQKALDQGISSSTARENAPTRFRFHWVSLVVYALFVIALTALVLKTFDGARLSRTGIVIAVIVFACALSLVVAYVLAILSFYIAKRSRRVGNAVFAAVLVLLWAEAARQQHTRSVYVKRNDAALTKLEATAAQISERANERIKAGTSGMLLIDEEAMDVIRAMRSAVEESTGRDEVLLRACTAVGENSVAAAKSLAEAYAAFNKAGGLNVSTINSHEALQARLEAAEELVKASDEYRAAIGRATGIFEQALNEGGFSESERNNLVSRFNSMEYSAKSLQLAEAHGEYIAATGEYLGYLDEQWGRWTYGRQVDRINFEETSQLEHFSKLATTLNERISVLAIKRPSTITPSDSATAR